MLRSRTVVGDFCGGVYPEANISLKLFRSTGTALQLHVLYGGSREIQSRS